MRSHCPASKMTGGNAGQELSPSVIRCPPVLLTPSPPPPLEFQEDPSPIERRAVPSPGMAPCPPIRSFGNNDKACAARGSHDNIQTSPKASQERACSQMEEGAFEEVLKALVRGSYTLPLEAARRGPEHETNKPSLLQRLTMENRRSVPAAASEACTERSVEGRGGTLKRKPRVKHSSSIGRPSTVSSPASQSSAKPEVSNSRPRSLYTTGVAATNFAHQERGHEDWRKEWEVEEKAAGFQAGKMNSLAESSCWGQACPLKLNEIATAGCIKKDFLGMGHLQEHSAHRLLYMDLYAHRNHREGGSREEHTNIKRRAGGRGHCYESSVPPNLINIVLPEECLLLIFEGLESAADWGRCSLVCQRWLRLANGMKKQIRVKDGNCLHRLLSRFTALNTLDLSPSTAKTSDERLVVVTQQCPNLQRLNLSMCQGVTDVGISLLSKGFPWLCELNLSLCQRITDASLKSIAEGCSNMIALDLTMCQGVTDRGLRMLSDGCPQLQTLNLYRCPNIRDGGLSALTKKRRLSLRNLNLTECSVGDASLTSIAESCPDLDTLILNATQVTDAGLAMLAQGCSNLRELDLRFTDVSCKGLAHLLHGCVRLVNLDMRYCSNVGALRNIAQGDFYPNVGAHSEVGQAQIGRGNPIAGLGEWSFSPLAPAACKNVRQRDVWGSLESLQLCGCHKLTEWGVAGLGTCAPQLKTLDLSLCGGISEWSFSILASGCPRLKSLSLRACQGVSAGVLGAIGRFLPDLESLVLSNCGDVTDAGLQLLGKGCLPLKLLNLTMCQSVSDNGIWAFCSSYSKSEQGHTPLVQLYLGGCTRVTDMGIRAIASLCPELRALDISSCQGVRDGGLIALGKGCRHLSSLDLTKCQGFSNHGLIAMAVLGCQSLQFLDVSMCHGITSLGVYHVLLFCKALRVLELRGCSGIGDDELAAIARTPSLAELRKYALQRLSAKLLPFFVIGRELLNQASACPPSVTGGASPDTGNHAGGGHGTGNP